MAETQKRLRVGVIGAGEVAQVIHLPVLGLLSHLYTTTAVCDISKKTAEHCAAKFHIPLATSDPNDIFKSSDIDVVFILTSDEFHEPYTIAALEAGKHVMIEKPFTLSVQSADRVIAAQAKSNGLVVFIGYMRRYAKSFTQTFKREVESIPRIHYARVRDFPGPNPLFVSQSGAFAVRHVDDIPSSAAEDRDNRLNALYKEVFPGDQPITEQGIKLCRFLGTLGSHDLSLMREVLGSPSEVLAVTANDPVYTAMFTFHNTKSPGKEPFTVTYESGWDEVPDFDAHLAVYGEKKRVWIQYDSPFVKGLAIKVVVQEKNSEGEIETREMLGSYEDAYTVELQELYECIVNGKKVKTSAEDAREDLRLYDEMYKKWAAGQAAA
ncbi:hypothetical protein CKM354_000922400 [Cercospora kikuchii]|uniref:Gfo/Idh/MocA-like oxidoreductase N-terminal domain-containing protein n=1 Tax=Cercospora kikuchii TaxID=84275 RepID=A0A9P3CSY3_9PEZI|nr:uncharacterized protein CKM354_000922400 [Cercospora kikuchii]GIZ46085.1 hypothetical protein CKM354_000922400 [Cercospora kikuchii]